MSASIEEGSAQAPPPSLQVSAVVDMEAIFQASQTLADSLASHSADRLEEAQAQIEAQLSVFAAFEKELRSGEGSKKQNPASSLILRAGGAGYKLWKAPHEALANEVSSRSPPMALDGLVAAPAVRGEAQRFQEALRKTVGALDVSEKAGKVMQEMLNSEREYFTDLGMLQRLYVKPLTEGARTRGYFLTERDLGDLFSNFDDIFKLNLDLLRQLEVESKKPQAKMDAGQLFLDFAEKFQVYAEYCANANAAKKRMEALALSNKRFADFCEKARSHSAHKGLDIGSFLIKPLQRLCQYPLLLRELLEALPDQENDLYARLRVMNETVEQVNGMLKSIRKRSELIKLGELLSFDGFSCNVAKPGRQYSASAPFRVRVAYPGQKEAKKWKQWEVWLLSDLLLLGEREKSKTSDRLVLKMWLPFESVILDSDGASALNVSTEAGGTLTKRLHKPKGGEKSLGEVGDIQLSCNGASISMQAESPAIRATWVKKLNKKLQAFRDTIGR